MLTCENVSIINQRRTLIDNLNLTIKAGERWVILGPNGSGKTSLLKACVNLNQYQGHIYVKQQNLIQLSFRQMAKFLSYIPQQSQVDSRISVLDYLQLASHYQHSCYKVPTNILDRLGISHYLTRPMGMLSGGQQQRAHIARALCQQTDLIILDEPLNHLDPQAQGDVLSLLKQTKKTILCSLHDIGLTAKFATHVLILNQGKVLAQGPVDKLITQENLQPLFNVDLLNAFNPRTQKTTKLLDIEVTSQK